MSTSVGGCCSAPTCSGECSTEAMTDIVGVDLGNTLARRLSPLADRMRNLYTRMGLRPYKVRMVVLRWSGGRRDDGVPQVLSSIDILPTPRVLSLDGINSVLNPGGSEEEGSVTIDQISSCFTEDQLRGLGERGAPIQKSDEFFYEIEYPSANGQDAVRRRFTVGGIPVFSAEKFGWSVRLERSIGDRKRNGAAR